MNCYVVHNIIGRTRLRISISYFKYHQMLTFTPTFNIHESTIELTLFSLPNVSGNA